MVNKGNKGEWAEIYIFLKLVSEGKVYMADENMQRLANAYMKVLKIFREENHGEKMEYIIGEPVKISKNDINIGPDTPISSFTDYANRTWTMIETAKTGNGIFDRDIALFLESIHINKLKAPAQSSADYFGGTEDIIMEVEDYRSGINSIMGFSCKSQFTAAATLFNASNNNTNFRYKVIGNIDDGVMATFNNLFNTVNRKNRITGLTERRREVAIAQRMTYLKEQGCDLLFVKPYTDTAKRNLIQSGGLEMPLIVGEMLKYYFFINNASSQLSNISRTLRYLAKIDPVHYNVEDLYGMYSSKIGKLLYDMFTGMRMASVWNGRQSVTGGYICAKNDGDIVAYHANVSNEFRDFLIKQLAFESPSADRHNYMKIEKEGNEYFINLNMQIRFARSEMANFKILEDKLIEQKNRITENLESTLRNLQRQKLSVRPNTDLINNLIEKITELKEELRDKEIKISEIKQKENDFLSGNGDC